jgi:hypothetical protein
MAKDDAFINLGERFNQHKLNHILKNEEIFRSQMRVFDDDYNPFTIATKYLMKSRNGIIKTKYKQNNSFGRFHALGSLSLQSLPREIRHTIANEYYTDIDIKNCHPVILSFLCAERGIACKYLNKYNNNRDKFLSELCPNKDQAKTIVLALVNGGKSDANALEDPPDWLNNFRKELKTIHKQFAKDPAFKLHKKKRIDNNNDYNHEASYMNILLCDFENKILQTIFKGLGSPKDCVLIFDGLMIPKEMPYDLAKLESVVEKSLGIEIKLEIKEMTEGFELGFDISMELEPYVEATNNTFDFTDKYDYCDFFKEFNGLEYEDVIEDVLIKYPKVVVHILDNEGCYIKKMENGNMCVVKALKTSDLKFKIKPSPITLSSVLSLLPNSFKSISCKLIDCPENEFNIWSGFQAKLVDVSSGYSNEFLRMKQFIMEVWANNDLAVYNHIINWFAGLVKNLGGINQMALVMVAQQGTGKNTFADFMKLILRSCNCATVDGIGEVVGRFNTILQGKRLIVVNELCSTKDEFRSNFDKIKGKITDSTIGIEPKGVNKYEIDNIGNYILFTNHRDAVVVEERDRRYSIHEMSDCRINDKEYFTNLRKDCFKQNVADEFYTYLMGIELVPCIPMMTDLRQEMMNMSKSTPLKFLDAVRDENMFEGLTEVKSSVFYTSYSRWCSENGERLVLTSTKFGTIINTKLQKHRRNDGCYYTL